MSAISQLIINHRPPAPRWDEEGDEPTEHWSRRYEATRAKDRLETWVRNAPEGKFRNNIPEHELRDLFKVASAVHRS